MSVPPPDPALPGLDGFVKRKKPRKESTRIPIKVGQVTVPVYRFADRWAVIYREAKGAKRQTLSFKTEKAARAKAAELCLKIANGNVSVDRLTSDERLQAVEARKLLTPHGLSLDGAAREIDAARELTGGAGILEMARFWAKHHPAGVQPCTVTQAHAELLAAKSDLSLNVRYRRELTRDLGTFAEAFVDVPIQDVTSDEILRWLRERKVGWRRRNKLQSLVVTLFRHAKNARHLPQDSITEPERLVPLAEPADAPPPGVLTVEEMRLVLAHVRPEYLAWAVLGAFAGLRQAEIERLRWERHFHWEDNAIEVSKEVAKRTTRKHGDARFVEMPANLAAWLRPYRQSTGLVCEFRGDRETGRLAKILPGGKWPHNALRHSYLSYLSALTGNLHTTAHSAGNSTEVARRNYINPRIKRDARAWFGIFPDDSAKENVIELPGLG